MKKWFLLSLLGLAFVSVESQAAVTESAKPSEENRTEITATREVARYRRRHRRHRRGHRRHGRRHRHHYRW